MVAAERRQVDQRVMKIIELKNKVLCCSSCSLLFPLNYVPMLDLIYYNMIVFQVLLGHALVLHPY